MRTIKLGSLIIWISIVCFVTENYIFGFNNVPQNDIEKQCDFFCNVILGLGLILYFLPLIKLYEFHVKKMDNAK